MSKQIVLKKATPRAKKSAAAANSDPVITTYRALAPLRVADEGGETTHMRMFGDYVPEAASWPRIDTWLITKRIETVHINQSELDRWWEEYRNRIDEEDAEQDAKNEQAREIAELERRIAELKGRPTVVPDFNAVPDRRAQPLEQKIDYSKPVQDLGGVNFNSAGPVEIPAVTRAPVPASHVGGNRSRPTTVRRAVVRKKG